VRQLVELEKVHPDIGLGPERGQHLSDELPSRSHLLDLDLGSILDHSEIVPHAGQQLDNIDRPAVITALARP
jgi:hypothetical protein